MLTSNQTSNFTLELGDWQSLGALATKNDMDQEQPTFKVTDRRLFNADGSPRDLPPEEKTEAKTEVTPTAEAAAVSTPEPVADQVEAESTTELPLDEEMSEQDIADAQDPTSFVNFLMSIASNAASALGMIEHPVTHERDVDLELGKHWIDVIGMLQKKTQGNLSAQEKQILEGLLRDLRMQYVSLTSAAPRKFSSSDITGGR
jgi:hypothetical protein